MRFSPASGKCDKSERLNQGARDPPKHILTLGILFCSLTWFQTLKEVREDGHVALHAPFWTQNWERGHRILSSTCCHSQDPISLRYRTSKYLGNISTLIWVYIIMNDMSFLLYLTIIELSNIQQNGLAINSEKKLNVFYTMPFYLHRIHCHMKRWWLF